MANDNQPTGKQERGWVEWMMSLSPDQYERQLAIAKLATSERQTLEKIYNQTKVKPKANEVVELGVQVGNLNQLQEAQEMLADIAMQTPFAEAIQVKNRKGQLITVTIVGPRASGKTRVLEVVEALVSKM